MSNAGMGGEIVKFVPWKLPVFGRLEPEHPQESEQTASDLKKAAYAEGFELGKQEGIEQARTETAAAVAQFVAVAESLSRHTSEFDEQIARDMVALASRIARQLVLRELKVEPGTIFEMVERLIDSLKTRVVPIIVHLHPHDAAAFNDHVIGNTDWVITPDVSLKRGDVRIEAADSVIHSTIDDSLEAIALAVFDESE